MPNCPQCGKAVYFAEQMKLGDRAFHKLCAKCKQCGKALSAGKEHQLPDGGIVCAQCAPRPEGFGFGAANLSSYKK